MSGTILAAARADARKHISEGGFEEDITIKTPDGGTTINTKGWATKHHINFDSDGNPINSKNVHICIDEAKLVTAGLTVRNAKGEVSLLNYLVSYPDSTGTLRDYIIWETWPNETLGLIVCILGDYNSA